MLLAKESYDHTWSGFGGRAEKGENELDTAVREGWEESMGFLGNRDDLRKMLTGVKPILIFNRSYYFVQVPRDIVEPRQYANAYDFVKQCGKVQMTAFCTEKTRVAWFDTSKVVSGKLGRDQVTNPRFQDDLKLIMGLSDV